MPFAVVLITGPPSRWVYINGGLTPEGRTNKHYAVEEGQNTFELKASTKGTGVVRVVNVVAQEPPMTVDLTPA